MIYFAVKKTVFKHLLLCHRTTHVVAVFGVLLAEEDTEFGVFMTTETEVVSLTSNVVRFTINETYKQPQP